MLPRLGHDQPPAGLRHGRIRHDPLHPIGIGDEHGTALAAQRIPPHLAAARRPPPDRNSCATCRREKACAPRASSSVTCKSDEPRRSSANAGKSSDCAVNVARTALGPFEARPVMITLPSGMVANDVAGVDGAGSGMMSHWPVVSPKRCCASASGTPSFTSSAAARTVLIWWLTRSARLLAASRTARSSRTAIRSRISF